MTTDDSRRKLLTLRELLLLFALALACVVVMFLLRRPNPNTAVAHISVNGREVKTIVLATAENGTFSLESLPGVSFELQDHTIRFVDVNCPDKLCENVGYISRPGQTAICLPNRVTLKITGEAAASEPDAVVW